MDAKKAEDEIRKFSTFRERTDKTIELVKQYKDKLDKGELLPHKWFVDNLFTDDSFGPFLGCNIHHVFQMYPKEFVEELARYIKKLGPKCVIEVGAGDGNLSRALQKHGVDSKPTDNYTWAKNDKHAENYIIYPEDVEKLDYQEALNKYNPDVVIICWEELSARYSEEILKHPSVKYVIWIGEGCGGCTGSETLFDKPHEYIGEPSQYALCRTDYPAFSEEGVHRHTGVWLFYKPGVTVIL